MNKLQMLDQIMKGNIELINVFDHELPACLEEEIIIKPSYVRNMLNKFLNKSLNANEINRWAHFICGRGEYIVPGGDDDEISDFYEDMYYVIQRLSTPKIDGEITEDRVKGYLKELDKYPDEL